VKKLPAKFVFDLIVSQAWKTGEPGIIFLDRINRDNPTPTLGNIESTNPCGEQPLLPYEACNLGSINLAKMVSEGKVDWEKLRETVRTSVHFLDNVIERSKYPLPQIERMVKGNRKIGLGVMGWADMLIQLGVPYDTEEAVALGEKVMKFITDEARIKSEQLGRERGSFPNFKASVFARKHKHMRNATVSTIAPTGTISIIANCSSGIEPLFAVSYIRNVMDGTELLEVNPLFKEVAKKQGFGGDKLMLRIAQEGSLRHIDEIPADVRRVFVTAHDITPDWHVRMQAAFQKHTDNAVSKTVNFPSDATTEDVEKTYLLAYKLGCKGVTIYRDKSRDEQVLNIGSVNKVGVAEQKPRKKKKKGKVPSVCPECKSKLSFEEGCIKCPSCGYSVCSV
jgi:ribonucleoside-diphosphate reductase alpha chain